VPEGAVLRFREVRYVHWFGPHAAAEVAWLSPGTTSRLPR
jgi:hypothetical protein